MTHEEVDAMWQQAMQESIKDGEVYIRYHFAKLVAQHEREACAKVCDEYGDEYGEFCADAIRSRGQA